MLLWGGSGDLSYARLRIPAGRPANSLLTRDLPTLRAYTNHFYRYRKYFIDYLYDYYSW